jgi:hypothetical protein
MRRCASPKLWECFAFTPISYIQLIRYVDYFRVPLRPPGTLPSRRKCLATSFSVTETVW